MHLPIRTNTDLAPMNTVYLLDQAERDVPSRDRRKPDTFLSIRYNLAEAVPAGGSSQGIVSHGRASPNSREESHAQFARMRPSG